MNKSLKKKIKHFFNLHCRLVLLCHLFTDLSKDAVEEMLGRDEETVNALEEFGFMMNDSSDSDSTVIEVDEDEQHANDFDEVNIHMPEEGEKPNHLPGEFGQMSR